jgi:hypothetical protein
MKRASRFIATKEYKYKIDAGSTGYGNVTQLQSYI